MPRPKRTIKPEAEEFRIKEPGEDPEYDAWFREQVQIGLDELEKGDLIPHEEMRRWFAEQEAGLIRKIDKPKRR